MIVQNETERPTVAMTAIAMRDAPDTAALPSPAMLAPGANGALTGSVRESDSPDVFASLAAREVQLALWRRPVPEGVTAALEAWARTRPARWGRIGDAAALDLADLGATLPTDVRGRVHADLHMLLHHFALCAGGRKVRLEFGPVLDNQCRKFHVDHMHLRLITTYLGPGTQWVPEHAVRRAGFGRCYGRVADANRAIVPDRTQVRHAVAGEVLAMKGVRHGDGLGVVHRSPPIRGSGRVRVVAVLSTVERD